MKDYPHIKKSKLERKEIAERLRYKNVNSFRNTSKYTLILELVEHSIKLGTEIKDE